MSNHSDARRRWIGAILLAISAVMLIAGETFLKETLRKGNWIPLAYWSGCFVFVLMAIIVALLDMVIMRKRLRAEQRGLVEETVQKILRDKNAGKGSGPDQDPGSSAQLRT